MKIIEIPYSPVNLMIFSGEDERSVFDLKVQLQYPEWESEQSSDGMHFENHIFIEDITDKEVVVHEVFHFLDWLFIEMMISMESEFKANIASLVILEALK